MISSLADSCLGGDWLSTDYNPDSFDIFTLVKDFNIKRDELKAFIDNYEAEVDKGSLEKTIENINSRAERGEITREERDELIERQKEIAPLFKYYYDYDVIYNADGSVKDYDELNDPVAIYDILERFCGVENFFTD